MRKALLLSALVVVSAASCSDNPSSKAKEFLRAKMYTDAALLLETSIQSDPSNPSLHLLLGHAYLCMGESKRCVEEFDRTAALDPAKSRDIGRILIENAGGLIRGIEHDPQAVSSFLAELLTRHDSERRAELADTLLYCGLSFLAVDPKRAVGILTPASEISEHLLLRDSVYYGVKILPHLNSNIGEQNREVFLSRFPGSSLRADVLYLSAAYLYRTGKRESSLARYQTLLAEFPAGSRVAEANSRVKELSDKIAADSIAQVIAMERVASEAARLREEMASKQKAARQAEEDRIRRAQEKQAARDRTAEEQRRIAEEFETRLTKDGLTIELPAKLFWNETGVKILAGDSIFFEVSGEIDFGGVRCNPDGHPTWGENGMMVGQAVGRIGENRFPIGRALKYRAPHSGVLFVGIFDSKHRDNKGSFYCTLKVKRTE